MERSSLAGFKELTTSDEQSSPGQSSGRTRENAGKLLSTGDHEKNEGLLVV